MYPLKVILVGCQESEAADLQRELVNQGAEIDSEFPDVKTVVATLSLATEEKRLFVLQLRTKEDIREVERLNETFSGRPILALMDGDGMDVDTMLRAMQAGAAQIVRLPLRVPDFEAALARISKQFGYGAAESRVIAVSGVTEGCGATSVAVNLAHEFSTEHKLPCILAEMSLRMGRLAVALNLQPRFTTQDLLIDSEHLDLTTVRQALVEVNDHLRVLTGPYRGISAMTVTPTEVLRLIEYLRRLADVVVLDMPYTFDQTYLKVMSAADQVVLLAEQEIPSVHGLLVVRETLAAQEHVGRQYLAINRYDGWSKTWNVKNIQELLKTDQVMTIANDYAGFQAAMVHGQPLRIAAPRSPALAGIRELSETLLGHAGRKGKHLPGFFSRLANALTLTPPTGPAH